MAFARISILGVGLLGGSIGLAVKSLAKGYTVVGYGHRRATLDKALARGAIDQAFDNPAEAVRGSDLVVLCTPVGLFEELLGKLRPALSIGTVVTDVGSTKRGIVRAALGLPASVHFVGSHPMAGSERRGVDAARADLFHNALCITTPTPQANASAVERVEAFWRTLGMRIKRLDPDTHDRLLASVSHLPHALAALLISMQDPEALELAGKGFLDTTRIASGDGGLWRDIFLDNRDNLHATLSDMRDRIDRLIDLIDPARADELRAWLDDAAQRRDEMNRKQDAGAGE